MKRKSIISVLLLLLLLPGCGMPDREITTIPSETEVTTAPAETVTVCTVPETTVPETTEPPMPTVMLTEEEKTMLLKLGMAERGTCGCRECIALVMRTVLNRVESQRFGSSIRSVIFAQDQYTPVSDGSYDSAEPNEACVEALEMVIYGWDESQGALFYEWCEGESWHSKNLHLLFQHCDTRFYD